ncbi:MAG: insulinase family protein [Hyphomicrobiaceae bacterium]
MFAQSFESLKASPIATRVSEYKLANGLQLIVVPDNRAPVVTHYVWYRVGAADEPAGVSGIAHFLEHLMFKSTDKIASASSPKASRAWAARTTPSPRTTTRATSSASPRIASRR